MQTYLTVVSHPLLWVFIGLLAGFYLILWATALDVRRLPPSSVWLRRNYPVVILTGVAILAIVALTFYLIEIGISVRVMVDRLREAATDPNSEVGDLQSLASSVAILVGVLAAAATILYSSIRVWINERTATATEEGLITDRINKAVQGLGAEKTVNRLGRTVRFKIDGVDGSYFEWIENPQTPPSNPDVIEGKVQLTNDPWSSFPDTQPNLEVRIGAIYALERIAQDSARDHVQVMEILCAYVRQNAPANPQLVFPDQWDRILNGEDHFDEEEDEYDILMPSRMEIQDWSRRFDKPREDIQVALTVIGRRSAMQIRSEGQLDAEEKWSGYRLDLRETCLQNADFNRANLDHALLTRAQCRGSKFDNASLVGADLFNAHLEGATFRKSKLSNVAFQRAELRGAFFRQAVLHGALFSEAQMQMANFSDAEMQKAILYGAKAQNAHFENARMRGARLTEARMQGADLMKCNLTESHIRWCRLEGAMLEGAVLSGADLENAFMDKDTDVSGAVFVGASLSSSDFSMTAISQDQAAAAFGDASVTLPKGVVRPAHWLDQESKDPSSFNREWRKWQDAIGYERGDQAS